jgi:hypothetical protein
MIAGMWIVSILIYDQNGEIWSISESFDFWFLIWPTSTTDKFDHEFWSSRNKGAYKFRLFHILLFRNLSIIFCFIWNNFIDFDLYDRFLSAFHTHIQVNTISDLFVVTWFRLLLISHVSYANIHFYDNLHCYDCFMWIQDDNFLIVWQNNEWKLSDWNKLIQNWTSRKEKHQRSKR